MEQFMQFLLENSIKSAVLAVLVWIVCTALSGKISSKWKYFLWVLVAVRLVMPNLFHTDFSIFNIGERSERQVPIIIKASAIPIAAEQPSVSVTNVVVKRVNPWTILFIIWAVGAGVLAGLVLLRNFRFSSKICVQRPLTDQKLLELLEDCKELMNIHVPVSVVSTANVSSPALMGFIRPRLLLPESMIKTTSFEDMRFVFMHELTHLKRKDIAANWLLTLVQITYWFNPFAWYAFFKIRTEREQACDESVLARLEQRERKDYGFTIIRLLEMSPQQNPVASMAGILEDKQQMKRRIEMIRNFRIMPFGNVLLALVLIFGLSVFCLSDEKEEETKVKKELTVEEKLKTIVIDKITMEDVNITTALAYLNARSKQFDPEKKGVPIFLELSPELIKNVPTVTFAVEGIKLGTAIDYLCKLTNMENRITSSGEVMIFKGFGYVSPRSSPEVEKKLKAIVIDKIKFEDITIRTAVLYLNERSKQLDPEKKGVKIILKMPEKMVKNPPTVIIDFDNISLGTAINYLCQASGMQYQIVGDDVEIFPREEK